MQINNLYVATVVNNDDPSKRGRVQIRVDAFMSGFQADHLPWAFPFSMGTGGALQHGASAIPEKETKIWVWFTDNYRKTNPYYLADAIFQSLTPAGAFDANIKSHIKGGSGLKYPHVKFIIYKNNMCQFVSTDPAFPFWGVFHPNGNQVVINNTGQIYCGHESQTLDPVVSTNKLKAYLAPKLGNLGGILFPDIANADLGFDNFFGGIGTVTPIPVEFNYQVTQIDFFDENPEAPIP